MQQQRQGFHLISSFRRRRYFLKIQPHLKPLRSQVYAQYVEQSTVASGGNAIVFDASTFDGTWFVNRTDLRDRLGH